MLALALVFVINAVISALNAIGCGMTWDSTKAKGGLAHFMNWMGAFMSASGFTWCYLVLVGLVLSVIPAQVLADEGEVLTGTLLNPEQLQVFYELGYMAIILPILGSGLAITLSTWRSFARKKYRTGGEYALTGWNTFAQVHNMYSAARDIPGIMDHLGRFFGGGSSSSSSGGSSDGKGKLLIIVGVVMAALAGILTTFSIIQATRRSVVASDYKRRQHQESLDRIEARKRDGEELLAVEQTMQTGGRRRLEP